MRRQISKVERKWKRIAVAFIVLFAMTSVVACFFFIKTNYPSRIATKLGWGGMTHQVGNAI